MNRDEAREKFSAAMDAELGDARVQFEELLAQDAELREEYAQFVALFRETQALSLDRDARDVEDGPTPDLLAGVQRKLRVRSGGRFYRDRFSERSVRGLSIPMLLAGLMLVALLALFLMLNWTTVLDASPPSPSPGDQGQS